MSGCLRHCTPTDHSIDHTSNRHMETGSRASRQSCGLAEFCADTQPSISAAPSGFARVRAGQPQARRSLLRAQHLHRGGRALQASACCEAYRPPFGPRFPCRECRGTGVAPDPADSTAFSPDLALGGPNGSGCQGEASEIGVPLIAGPRPIQHSVAASIRLALHAGRFAAAAFAGGVVRVGGLGRGAWPEDPWVPAGPGPIAGMAKNYRLSLVLTRYAEGALSPQASRRCALV